MNESSSISNSIISGEKSPSNIKHTPRYNSQSNELVNGNHRKKSSKQNKTKSNSNSRESSIIQKSIIKNKQHIVDQSVVKEDDENDNQNYYSFYDKKIDNTPKYGTIQTIVDDHNNSDYDSRVVTERNSNFNSSQKDNFSRMEESKSSSEFNTFVEKLNSENLPQMK